MAKKNKFWASKIFFVDFTSGPMDRHTDRLTDGLERFHMTLSKVEHPTKTKILVSVFRNQQVELENSKNITDGILD